MPQRRVLADSEEQFHMILTEQISDATNEGSNEKFNIISTESADVCDGEDFECHLKWFQLIPTRDSTEFVIHQLHIFSRNSSKTNVCTYSKTIFLPVLNIAIPPWIPRLFGFPSRRYLKSRDERNSSNSTEIVWNLSSELDQSLLRQLKYPSKSYGIVRRNSIKPLFAASGISFVANINEIVRSLTS